MSTTTSNTEPCTQVTYLAWLGGTWAKCRPRSAPAADTEQLACRTFNRWPANPLNPRWVIHSKNMPRESRCMAGVISQAPGILSSRTFISLTAFRVAGLGSILQWAPPRFVVAIPLDGVAQAIFEVGMLWRPTQFVVELGRVDGIAQVVADAIGDVVEVVGVAAHHA